MSCANCTPEHRCGQCHGYTGPERRIPLDSKAVRWVLAGVICFWLVLVFGVPALVDACVRAFS